MAKSSWRQRSTVGRHLSQRCARPPLSSWVPRRPMTTVFSPAIQGILPYRFLSDGIDTPRRPAAPSRQVCEDFLAFSRPWTFGSPRRSTAHNLRRDPLERRRLAMQQQRERTYDFLPTSESNRPIKGWTRGVPVEPEALKQLQNMASLPFIHRWLAVMPDVHLGKGATVG